MGLPWRSGGLGSWSGPSITTDPEYDAKGDLIFGTGADTSDRLAVGADDTILMADAAASQGAKWVASGTPSTQAFGDAAAVGTADTFARGDHKHAMPADGLSWGFPVSFGTIGFSANVANVQAASTAHYQRAVGAGTLTKIGLVVNTQNGNIDVGIYTGVAGINFPTTRKGSAGATACPAAGYAEVSLTGSTVCSPGDWFALAADGTTADFRVGPDTVGFTNFSKGFLFRQPTAYVLPASADGSSAGAGIAACMVGVA